MATSYNVNNAQSASWLATIHGMEGIAFKLRSFQLPSVTVGMVDLGGQDIFRLKETGNQVTFDDLQLDFIVDVDYKNYLAAFQWLVNNARAGTAQQLSITVHMLDNAGAMQGLAFEFQNAFPIMLGPSMMDVENETTDVIMTLTITYSHFSPVVEEMIHIS